jgi:hypothetical protein
MKSMTRPDDSTSPAPRAGLPGGPAMGILEYSVATLPDFVGREIGVSQWTTVDQNRCVRGVYRRSAMDTRGRRASRA